MTKPTVICITGPESSGKSTLASALSSELQAVLIAEYAREYLNALPNPTSYTADDLYAIAQKQLQDLRKALATNQQVIIIDTGVEVVKIWHEEKYGRSQLLEDLLNTQQELVTHYMLCSPDMPWEPDPLRENPTDRSRLFKLYEQLLSRNRSKFLTISGSPMERLKATVAFINAT